MPGIYAEELLAKIGGRRTKQAAPLSEAGSIDGSTSHPVGDADDNLIDVQTGEHAAELERGIKEQQPPTTINSVPDAKATDGSGGQADVAIAIRSTVSATGEDASIEDNYKGDKDDPGTTSVMTVDDGEKYAAYAAMPLSKLASAHRQASDRVAAHIAVNGQQAPTKQAAPTVKEAAAHGAALAASVTTDRATKEAAAHAVVTEVIEAANLGAILYRDFYKKAGFEDEATEGAGPDGGEGGPPPGAGGGEGGPPPGMEGGGMPPPGMDQALAGVPGPEAGMGGEGGGAGITPEAIAEAVLSLGIDPEALIQAAQANGVGGPPPPDAPPAGDEGMPKMARATALQVYKMAGVAKQYANGRTHLIIPPPRDKKAAEGRYAVQHYLCEVLGLGRAR